MLSSTEIVESLSNNDGDPEDNAYLDLTFEFRNCLDMFSEPLGLRTCSS